jgi:hypothetical protein
VDLVVVGLDVVEVDGVAEARGLEQVPRVGPQHRHLGELVAVALEVPVVDGVEAGEGREQPDVGLGDGVAHEEPLGLEALGQPVQPGEQAAVGVLVAGLVPGEPALVDPVVHVPVDELHHLVHLVAEVLGVQVGRILAVVLAPLGGQVEGDLGVVVGDHLAGLDLDHRRDGDPLRVVGVAGEVGLLQPLDAEHGVAPARVEVEGPAALVVGGPAHAHRQHVLEAEQPAHDDRPVRPRAGPGDHQAVPAGLDRVAVAAVGRDADHPRNPDSSSATATWSPPSPAWTSPFPRAPC